MDKETTKSIYIKYFQTRELLGLVDNTLPLTFLGFTNKKRMNIKLEPLIQSIRSQAQNTNLNKKLLEKFLGVTIDGLMGGKRPKALSNFVRSDCDRLYRVICSIPNTVDKAYDALHAFVEVEGWRGDQVYDAFVLLSNELSPILISREIQNWKEESKRHEAELNRHLISPRNIFWVSADFHDDIDGISRYRFREHFDFGEFEAAFSEVESMFEANIAPAAAGMAEMKEMHGSSELQALAFELWLTSRSPSLSNRIRDSINLASNNIAKLQSPEGWWTDTNILMQYTRPGRKRRYLPGIHITALCSLDLLKLSFQDSHKESGLLGAQWLLSKQNADGSWSHEKFIKDKIECEPEIFTTLLALEVLVRSGIRNVKHSINSGIEWILKQQDTFGTWNDEGFPFPFMTVIILELLRLKENYTGVLGHYQSVSKGFLRRSVQLSLEDNTSSRQLAIIATYHGLEAFLYSILSQPSINIPIFNKKGNNTIGMKKALDKFQAYLRQNAIIESTEAVSYRNSLDRLGYLRDQIVHKAVNVTELECHHLVDDAFKFTIKYSLQIFGFDILS